MGYNCLIEQKTLWEKKKMLFMSIFFFSHNVFKSCLLLMHQNEYLLNKRLKFRREVSVTDKIKSVENILSKGERTVY